MRRPFGYFVHHQGRGHAERCAAIVHALPSDRTVVLFCARDDIFPPLPPNVQIVLIPSLFEKRGDEVSTMDHIMTPATLHCAPLGWPSIREAMATIVMWFNAKNPALMICDVSAEIAQLSRICSVPHVKILQHGKRDDAGHKAAYEGAVGLLAPFHSDLAQSDWSADMLKKTCFAPGLGVNLPMPDRNGARERIGVSLEQELIVVVSGGGGSGFAQAPFGIGARGRPNAMWVTIGTIDRDWHATEPNNIKHHGWVANPNDYIAAADLVISSTGNTTCQQVLAASRPWIAVPEWRYFDEQHCKAEELAKIGAALVLPRLPSSSVAWASAIEQAYLTHRPATQQLLVEERSAVKVARWLEDLTSRIWPPETATFIHREI